MAPRAMVAPSQKISAPRLSDFSAWWAMVMVTPELSSSRVLTSGRPQAGIDWKAPPIPAGPLLGQPAVKPGHRYWLVRAPAPSPDKIGRASRRDRADGDSEPAGDQRRRYGAS